MHFLILITILLSYQNLLCVSHAVEEEKEQPLPISLKKKRSLTKYPLYSDEIPNTQFIDFIDLSERFEWSDQKKGKEENLQRRIPNITKQILKIVEKAGYQYIKGIDTLSENKIDFIFAKKKEDCFKKTFFLETQYFFDATEPSFEEKVGYFPPQAYGRNKWEIPFVKPEELMKKETVRELSWKWVDLNLHRSYQQINTTLFNTSSEKYTNCKKMYNLIKDKGLELALPRIVVVINNEKKFFFHALFNDKEDKKRSEKVIETLIRGNNL